MRELVLYSRDGCHLCDEMIQEIQSLLKNSQFEISIVDVESDEELERRFGALVPILFGEEQEICHYFLDHAAVNAYLGNIL